MVGDRKKEKGEPGERTNVPAHIILQNMVPANEHRKFILRAVLKVGHPLTLALTRLGRQMEGESSAAWIRIMLERFASASLYTEVKYSEKFPISTVFIVISAVSHLNSKLRFVLLEMFHLRKMEQNHKKGIYLAIVKSNYSVSLLSLLNIQIREMQEDKEKNKCISD